MVNSNIWHISSGKEFPLELWKHPSFSIQVKNIELSNISNIKLQANELNILFLNVSQKEWEDHRSKILREFDTNPNVSLLLVQPTELVELQDEPRGTFLILSHPPRKKEIKFLIDKSLQAELYKRATHEITQNCLENMNYVEGIFDMSRKENVDKQNTIIAMEKMLEYHAKVKNYQEQMNKAIDEVNVLRNEEILTLHERIKATEMLDELKTKELMDAQKLREATEAALQFSRIEEITQDKIINAQNKLFEYTDKEIRNLVLENKELKKRLGLAEDAEILPA
jgi:hypothetical protein